MHKQPKIIGKSAANSAQVGRLQLSELQKLLGIVAVGWVRVSMRRSAIILAGLASLLLVSGGVSANPTSVPRGQDYASPFMRVFGLTQPPYGFVNFCERTPHECAQGPQEEQRFFATPARMAELDTVNRAVNHEIEPITDLELYGVTDYWTIPTTKGDCEDYVLLKRKRLMDLGWPASALLITVVRDERGEGHAVLTARTMQGDFILDNKTDEIRVWHRTRYDFLMRQSYLNPRIWMSLDPREMDPSLPSAGVRRSR
jgi:predicted transglutaminase-like cysteine proteinase